MEIRNVRSHVLEIAATGQFVDPDATAEVDDELGASLLEQPDNWQPASDKDAEAAKKAAAKAARAEKAAARAAAKAANDTEGDEPDDDTDDAAPSGEED